MSKGHKLRIRGITSCGSDDGQRLTLSRGKGKTTQLAAPRARLVLTSLCISCLPMRLCWNRGKTATSHTDAANAPSDTALRSKLSLTTSTRHFMGWFTCYELYTLGAPGQAHQLVRS